MVGNALCAFELLVLRGGNLIFSAKTTAIAAAPSEAEIGTMGALLNDLLSDPVFCWAYRASSGSRSALSAQQVRSAISCAACSSPTRSVSMRPPTPTPTPVERWRKYSPDLLHLLEQEVLALPVRENEERVSAPLYFHLQPHP